MRRGAAPSRVVEILEAEGDWMTFDQIHAAYTQQFCGGDLNLIPVGTIRTAARRAVAWGAPIEVRRTERPGEQAEPAQRAMLYGDTALMQTVYEVAEYRHCA
jgi:hypothetical protein